jgi:tetratricopeptide (TPR) repeat protein
MKFKAISTTLLLAASLSFAQSTPPPATGGQSSAQNSSGQSSSGSSGTAAGQAAPANGGQHVLQAKSPDELNAYKEAEAKTDPAQAETAANAFAEKYPTSELRTSLYMRTMNLYAQANNTDKVIDTGRKAIAADPTNPVALVQVGSTLAETTRDTDLDKEQRYSEAEKDAHSAIDNVDTGLLIPANADPARIAVAKRSILTMAYDTLGTVDMNRNDYAAAVTNLEKAVDESTGNPDPVLYLRLSVAQDHLQQYPQALDSANKAVQYAREGTAAQSLAKQQQARLQKLVNAGSATPGGAPAMASPSAPMPGAQPGSPVPGPGSSPPQPHE